MRYIAELRVEGRGIISAWVEVDPRSSDEAPDDERFGVVTADRKLPQGSLPKSKCPDWVNDS